MTEAAGMSNVNVRTCSFLFPSFKLTSVTDEIRPSKGVGKKPL